jgi:hypothetical protein
MAVKKKKTKTVSVTASGSVVGRGKIAGKGTVTLSLADATKVKLSVDTKPSGTKVVLKNATEVRVWKSQKVKITGSIEKDFNTKGLSGKVGLSFTLPKGVGVSVTHQYKPGDNVTSLKIAFSF